MLFIAPIVSSSDSQDTKTIFDLLSAIDGLYESVDTEVGHLGRPLGLHTSISYGLSISYYKYPLYEALKSARELLFDKAKHVDGKMLSLGVYANIVVRGSWALFVRIQMYIHLFLN